MSHLTPGHRNDEDGCRPLVWLVVSILGVIIWAIIVRVLAN